MIPNMNKKIIHPIFNFRANTFIKAFILSSIILSLTTMGAVYTHDFLYNQEKNKDTLIFKIKFSSGKYFKLLKPIILFVNTFLIGLISYLIMFYLFGFGGGMLVPMKHKDLRSMEKHSLLETVKKPATLILKKNKI